MKNIILLAWLLCELFLTITHTYAAEKVIIHVGSNGRYTVNNAESLGFKNNQQVTQQQATNIVGCSTGGDCSMFAPSPDPVITPSESSPPGGGTPSSSDTSIGRSSSTKALQSNESTGPTGIYVGATSDTDCIRNGCFTMDDIPKIITGIIEILLGLAGTISIVALIYHALQMQLASGITGDSSGVDKAKAGMKGALLGFALSLSAWFLITKFVELLTSVT